MIILNKEAVDTFLWDHRNNGCNSVKGDLLDDEGHPVNIAWRDNVTGEKIEMKYDCS